jgi:hypothetical protein
MRKLFPKLFLPAALALFLGACTTAQQGALLARGAEANDRAAAIAVTTLCRVISIGAWTRLFGQSKDKAAAWQTMCASSDITPPRVGAPN